MDSMSQSENYSKIRPMTQEERNRSKVREETNRFSFGMQIDGGMLYDAAKLYWMVKGHIPDFLRKAPDYELEQIIDGYTKRLWNNEEAYLRMEGFYDAWDNFKKG